MAGRKVGEKVGRYGAGSLKETAPGSGRWDYGVRINGRQVWRRSPRGQADRQAGGTVEERDLRPAGGRTTGSCSASARQDRQRPSERVVRPWPASCGVEWSRRQKNDTRSRLDHRIIPTLGEIRLADLTR